MLITIVTIKSIIFTILTLLNIFGYASIINKIFKNKTNCFFSNFVFGTLLITLFSYLINFISPLNINITNSFFILFTILGLINFNYIFLHKYKNLIFLCLVVTFITVLSKTYNDFELYHLPYMELIRKFKIIFGLSNFDFRYAHASVFQNISAFQYNSFMGKDSYYFYTPIIFMLSLQFVFEKLFSSRSNLIILIGLISLIYFIIHGSRYGALGNDYPTHILAIIAIMLFIEIRDNQNTSVTSPFLFLTIISIIILSKFSMIFFLILPLYLIFIKKLKINFNILFFIILGFIFVSKSFINSSCLVYPIPKLCFETKWSVDKYSFGSPETISTESSVMVKAYMESDYLKNNKNLENVLSIIQNDYKYRNIYKNLSSSQKEEFIKYVNYKNYLNNKIWIFEYFKGNDFYKFLKNVILLSLLIFLAVFIHLKINNLINFSKKKCHDFLNENKFLFFFVSLNFLFWLFNFPQLRYGLSYVLIFSTLPSIIYFSNSNLVFFRDRIVIPLMTICIIYAIYSNIFRIYNFDYKKILINGFDTNIVILNKKPNYLEINLNNGIKIKQPQNGVCSDIEQLCSVFTDRFVKSGREIYLNSNNYLFIK